MNVWTDIAIANISRIPQPVRDTERKACPSCNTEKPMSEFRFRDNQYGGYFSKPCKACEMAVLNERRRARRAAARVAKSITVAAITNRGNQHKTPVQSAIVQYMQSVEECTTRELMDKFKLDSATVSKVLSRLKKRNQAHVVRYQRSKANNMQEAVWRVGAGVSAANPYAKPEPEEVIVTPRPQLGAWGVVW